MTRESRFLDKAAMLSNMILITGGMACLVALSYSLYQYGWTGRRQFTNWQGPLLYYALPAVAALSLFACLRLRAIFRVNLALGFCSIAASVYIVQLVTVIWFNLPSIMEDQNRKIRAKAAQAAGVSFDSRGKEDVIDELRRRGEDAIPSVSPKALLQSTRPAGSKSPIILDSKEVLPLAGIANKHVVLCNEAGNYVSYKSDEYGFNNPESLWKKIPIEVVALGDSFVQGYCTVPGQDVVALIRSRYPNTLNLGIEGNGPLAMLATLREYASRFKPKVVLWFYFEGNDLADLALEKNNPILTNYLKQAYSQGLFHRQTEIDRALLDYVENIKSKPRIFLWLEELLGLFESSDISFRQMVEFAKLGPLRVKLGLVHGEKNRNPAKGEGVQPAKGRDAAVARILPQILLQAQKEVSSWNGKLYFIYLPVWYRYGEPERGDMYRDRVLQIANSIGVPVIDVHQTFARQRDPLELFPFRLPAHYTEAGNRLVAEQVIRSISFGD